MPGAEHAHRVAAWELVKDDVLPLLRSQLRKLGEDHHSEGEKCWYSGGFGDGVDAMLGVAAMDILAGKSVLSQDGPEVDEGGI